MSMESYRGLLADFGRSIGLAELAPDADGYCALSFDDLPVHLQYEPDDDEVLVFTRLGPIQDPDHEGLLVLLMAANLFWAGTGGATLGLQPEDASVFLMQRRPLAVLDCPRLVALLEKFVTAADHWAKEAADYVSSGVDVEALIRAVPGSRDVILIPS